MHVPGVTGNRKHRMALSSGLYGSRYSKVALVVLGVGVVFHVIGFSVPEWQRLETNLGTSRIGLWKNCDDLNGCTTRKSEDWLLSVQVLESLAVCLEILALLCSAFYLYRGTRLTAYLTALMAGLAGSTAMSGAAVYWTDHNKLADLYWGFAFEVIGALNCIAGGCLFVFEGRTRTRYVALT